MKTTARRFVSLATLSIQSHKVLHRGVEILVYVLTMRLLCVSPPIVFIQASLLVLEVKEVYQISFTITMKKRLKMMRKKPRLIPDRGMAVMSNVDAKIELRARVEQDYRGVAREVPSHVSPAVAVAVERIVPSTHQGQNQKLFASMECHLTRMAAASYIHTSNLHPRSYLAAGKCITPFAELVL
jgi:hypothetical protein